MRNQKMAAALPLSAFVLLAALLAAPAVKAQAPVEEPGKATAEAVADMGLAAPLTRPLGSVSSAPPAAAFAPETIELSSNFEAVTWLGEGWTVANGAQADQWYIGTVAGNGGSEAGSYAAYISNDGGASHQYGVIASVVHFYRDVTFPAGEPSIQLTFDWKGYGEPLGQGAEDYLQVTIVDTTVTPTAGTQLAGDLLYYGQSAWRRSTITLASDGAGTTKRVVFSWINDGDTKGYLPPAAVDNILIYTYPAEYGYGNCLTQASEMSNCTANDLHFGGFQVLGVSGQCTTPSSKVQVMLKGGVGTNATDRYDMAFWINVAGGSALSDSTRLACYRHVLNPLVSSPWTGLNLAGGEGPYRNIDGDYCGDAYSFASDGWNIANFQTLSLPCTDSNGDGALDFSLCLGYDNQAHNNCNGYLQAWPSETSKCLCDDAVTLDVTTLKMSITKSCTPHEIPEDSTNRTIACTIAYKNESGIATTAGTFQIVDDYDQTKGGVSNISNPGPGTDNGDTITWTLPSVAAGASGSVTYNYTINTGLAEGTIIRNTALLQYSAGATAPYAQQDIVSADSTVIAAPTAVTLINLAAAVQGDAIEIGWDTVNEMDHLGFNLYRATDASVPGVKLNADLIPAQGVGSPLGFHYSYLDSAELVPETTYTYWLEDLSTTGVATRHAPISVLFGSDPNAVHMTAFGYHNESAGLIEWAALGLISLAAVAIARRRRAAQG